MNAAVHATGHCHDAGRSAHLAATLAALWIAFGIGAAADFKYFYALFLPIMWSHHERSLAERYSA